MIFILPSNFINIKIYITLHKIAKDAFFKRSDGISPFGWTSIIQGEIIDCGSKYGMGCTFFSTIWELYVSRGTLLWKSIKKNLQYSSRTLQTFNFNNLYKSMKTLNVEVVVIFFLSVDDFSEHCYLYNVPSVIDVSLFVFEQSLCV